MKKYYTYHTLIMAAFGIILVYSLLQQKFLPVAVAAIFGLVLIFWNYQKNHPAKQNNSL